MAAGVDTSSHLGALDAGGYTAGNSWWGIDSIYPRENLTYIRKFVKQEESYQNIMLEIPSQRNVSYAKSYYQWEWLTEFLL